MWKFSGVCVSVYVSVCVCVRVRERESSCVVSWPREQSSGIKLSSCPKGKPGPERAYLWNKTTTLN